MDEKKNRQSWLTAGLQTLASHGPEGLRIMFIAEQLGVTKGSFYWHFRNLEGYQLALLEEWERTDTQDAIEYMESLDMSDVGKLQMWITGASGANFALVRAIRSWSLTNPHVKAVQIQVDEKRIAYLSKLLRGIGWSKEEAMTLGRWTYGAWVGYATLEGPMLTNKQIALMLRVLEPG